MKPLTPAAVRAAMKAPTKQSVEERRAYNVDGRRRANTILRDHIRTVAAEMRAQVPSGDVEITLCGRVIREQLNHFADKLEGIAP